MPHAIGRKMGRGNAGPPRNYEANGGRHDTEITDLARETTRERRHRRNRATDAMP